MKVGFQGIKGAYSEMAAKNYFKNEKMSLTSYRFFEDIFVDVASGKLQYGVIPIENSLAGSIHENYDHLLRHDVWIDGEYFLRVRHSLLGTKDATLAKIKKVYSHPQALGQCASFLKSRKLEVLPYFDTAGSALFVSEEQDPLCAAIAGAHAAEDYNLKVLKSSIEDNKQNYTRFFIIKKKKKKNQPIKKASKTGKTTLVFSLKDSPGGLHRSLSVFAIRDIDLTKIESRPLRSSPWKYLFYLDIAGYYDDDGVNKAVGHLEEISEMTKILGSYQPDSLSKGAL